MMMDEYKAKKSSLQSECILERPRNGDASRMDGVDCTDDKNKWKGELVATHRKRPVLSFKASA